MVFVSLTTGLSGWLTLYLAAPTYEERSVYDWMFETRSMTLDENPGLREIGIEALPYLIDALRTEETPFDRFAFVRDPGVRSVLTNLTSRPGWTHSGKEIRHAAIRSLLAFGDRAEAARDQLNAELRRTDTSLEYQRLVLECVARIGFGTNPTNFSNAAEGE